ncbi:hypothetical protein CDS [Bradyrhizobium sp.]|nr:hypothetical protein CDS [Bradyrhizobium sp.]
MHFRSLGLIGAGGLTRAASKCERLDGVLRLTRERARTILEVACSARPTSI